MNIALRPFKNNMDVAINAPNQCCVAVRALDLRKIFIFFSLNLLI